MSYSDYLVELAKHLKLENVEALFGEHADRWQFKLTTNERGKQFLEELERYTNRSLHGLSVLDVGCAYGGFVIESARRGARALGVDVNPKYLDLARANARGDVEVEFLEADASTAGFRHQISERTFDIVVLNDVLEHVYDTAGLIENLTYSLKEGGLLYFSVPNGMSVEMVESEGHKKVPILSLVPPDCWHYFLGPGRPRIFYRRWVHYQSIFAHFGMDRVLWWSKGPFGYQRTKTALGEKIEQMKNRKLADQFDSRMEKQIATEVFDKYVEEFEYDSNVMTAENLGFKYGTSFWRGLCVNESKSGLRPSLSSRLDNGVRRLISRW